LLVQVYVSTLEYETTVWKNYNVSEEILEEDGKGETNTIIMGQWNTVVGDKSYQNIVRPHVL